MCQQHSERDGHVRKMRVSDRKRQVIVDVVVVVEIEPGVFPELKEGDGSDGVRDRRQHEQSLIGHGHGGVYLSQAVVQRLQTTWPFFWPLGRRCAIRPRSFFHAVDHVLNELERLRCIDPVRYAGRHERDISPGGDADQDLLAGFRIGQERRAAGITSGGAAVPLLGFDSGKAKRHSARGNPTGLCCACVCPARIPPAAANPKAFHTPRR